MKSLLYTLLALALTGPAMAQVTEGEVRKPVIDNIHGRNDVPVGLLQTGELSGIEDPSPVVEAPHDPTTEMSKPGDKGYHGVVDGHLDVGALRFGHNEALSSVRKLLRVFPNPAVNYLKIDLGVATKDVEIIIVDIIGRQVYSKTGEFQTVTVNVNEFSPGAYFIRIRSGQDLLVKRVEVTGS